MSNWETLITPITEITPEVLIGLLRFVFNAWQDGELPPFTSAITAERVVQFQANAEVAVGEFYANDDLGYAHSCAVYNRLKEIAEQSPRMIRLMTDQEKLSDRQAGCLFTWAAMFHDLMRFFGFGTPDHEVPAAKLARAAFSGEPDLCDLLAKAVICHEYLCPIADGKELPILFQKSPLAEMFRLADKTSLSPAEEIDRWYRYGRRYGQKFFNPNLSDEVRFDLLHNYEQCDQLSILLVFFAVQPSDFYAYEVAEIYRQWARGKTDALRRIMAIARKEKTSERAVVGVVRRFYDHYQLPMPSGSESLRCYS